MGPSEWCGISEHAAVDEIVWSRKWKVSMQPRPWYQTWVQPRPGRTFISSLHLEATDARARRTTLAGARNTRLRTGAQRAGLVLFWVLLKGV